MSGGSDGSDIPSPYDWPVWAYVWYEDDGVIKQIGTSAAGFISDWINEGHNIMIVPEVPHESLLLGARVDLSGEEPELVARTANPSYVDGVVVRGIPNPSTVTINRQTVLEVTDGILELSSDVGGVHSVWVESGVQYAAVHLQVDIP